MTIYYSPRFQCSYKRLDPQLQKASEKRVALFRSDPLDQRLGHSPSSWQAQSLLKLFGR